MSKLLRVLNKPEYFFQPRAILSRLTSRSAVAGSVDAPLPWGVSIEVDPMETVGRSLIHRGIFELAVVEAMFRLIDPGDLVLDIGANIGFMSIAAASCHDNVEVVAFEPHPALHERLQRNCETWFRQRPDLLGRIRLVQAAVSDQPGTALLHVPRDFDGNQGIASLVDVGGSGDSATIAVETITIDSVLEEAGRSVGLLKIDIEGHELAAFHGATHAMQRGQIRDIVFEDHRGVDSAVCQLLKRFGYEIFVLSKLPWRPALYECEEASWAAAISFDAINLLATREPVRARQRMSGLGYRCYAQPARGVVVA